MHLFLTWPDMANLNTQDTNEQIYIQKDFLLLHLYMISNSPRNTLLRTSQKVERKMPYPVSSLVRHPGFQA